MLCAFVLSVAVPHSLGPYMEADRVDHDGMELMVDQGMSGHGPNFDPNYISNTPERPCLCVSQFLPLHTCLLIALPCAHNCRVLWSGMAELDRFLHHAARELPQRVER